jgi:predicted PurR-regulated permease PerM
LLVAVSAAFVWILLPFFDAVLWGVIVGVVFSPLYRWTMGKVKGRRNLAALLTLLIASVIVILPMMLMIGSLVQEGARLINRVQTMQLDFSGHFHRLVSALPDPVAELVGRFGLDDFDAIRQRVGQVLGRAAEFFATKVVGVGQNTLDLVINFFIMLYLAFFLLRDGRELRRILNDAIPLKEADKQHLATKFATVVRATIKGNVVIAVVQGTLGGLAFWVLGIQSALLWAVVMALLSLLPAVGAGLVWVPAAIYLLVTGAVWQGIVLIAYGVLVIGLVDNVLRPVLVGKDTRLPDYLVLISTVGGLAVFGINGFVIGPMIAAMFVAVWDIFATANRQARAEDAQP